MRPRFMDKASAAGAQLREALALGRGGMPTPPPPAPPAPAGALPGQPGPLSVQAPPQQPQQPPVGPPGAQQPMPQPGMPIQPAAPRPQPMSGALQQANIAPKAFARGGHVRRPKMAIQPPRVGAI